MTSYIEQLKAEIEAIEAVEKKIVGLQDTCFKDIEGDEVDHDEELIDSYMYLALQKAVVYLQDQRMTTDIQIYAYNQGAKREETNQ